jgi:lipid II:glycine glycyltransferase (peptidoglycan interpeptide bridge formation enzyme)
MIPTKLRTHLYTSNGPTIDWNNKEAVKTLVHFLKELGKENGALFVRIDPLIEDNPENAKMLSNLGLKKSTTNTQAEVKWCLDITPSEDELLACMKKNTRYSIRRSEREGVTVHYSNDISDFEKFWNLLTETVERQRFVRHPKQYYIKQIEAFSDQYRIYWAEYKGKVLATALMPFYGNTVFYLHASASTQRLSNVFPAHLLIWQTIKDAKNEGLKYLDFWGIAPNDNPKHPWAGFTFFKKSFGGFQKNMVRAHDAPLSLQYYLVRVLERTRRLWGGIYFNLLKR